jgi:hypothetical protein
MNATDYLERAVLEIEAADTRSGEMDAILDKHLLALAPAVRRGELNARVVRGMMIDAIYAAAARTATRVAH